MSPRRPSAPVIIRSLILLVGVLMLVVSGARAQAPGPTVVVLPTTGVVDQVMSGYIREGILTAEAQGAEAVVIELDTPGGSLDATREIVQAELSAPLPVIVYVAPAGSRAASAGTFITLAANVAAMAPATNIGAATPVSGEGQDIEGDLGQKVLNDTIATITSISEERDRPVEWAVSTVVEAESYTVDEALAAGAIDIKADSLEAVLDQADGMVVDVAGEEVVLETAGASLERLDMNPFQQFLHLLSDPNIAFILLTLGFYGVFFELQSPNYVTGILGAFALILAFIGFGSLPLNIAGLLLIGLAVILFILELTVTSGGLLTVGGLVAFALGGAALYTQPGDPVAPAVSVDWRIIGAMTVLTGLVVLGIVYAALQNRGSPGFEVGSGKIESPLVPQGTSALVHRTLAPGGTIYAVGEEWSARTSDGGALERGTTVRVIGQDGMTLVVERMLPSEVAVRAREAATPPNEPPKPERPKRVERTA